VLATQADSKEEAYRKAFIETAGYLKIAKCRQKQSSGRPRNTILQRIL
jgi:hypothetical protein